MKKIISFALVLTFVLAMFTCGFAEEPAKIPGVAHYTGEWEVVDGGKGIKALNGQSILVLEKTAKSGSIEFTVNGIGNNGMPALIFKGGTLEKVDVLGNPAIEQKSGGMFMFWLTGSANLSHLPDGIWGNGYHNYDDTYEANFQAEGTYNLKVDFTEDGKVTVYLDGVKIKECATDKAVANNGQIGFRGAVTAANDTMAAYNSVFSNVKVNGEEVLFAEKPVQTGDATVIAVATVSFAVLACGAVLTISKKRIAE